MHVGFVGTGNMGSPMAANVLKAGHRLTVYDARPEATVELEPMGELTVKGFARPQPAYNVLRLKEPVASAG